LKNDPGEETSFEETKEEARSIQTFFVLDSGMTAENCSPSNLAILAF
jgi:hypothetical protein